MNNHKTSLIELYKLIIDKCYRMNLLDECIPTEDLISSESEDLAELIDEMDNKLSTLLLPRIHRILDRSLFDMYQVLYTIDVDEQFIKEKIMSVENIASIPSLIAFAIIDRLKWRYLQYPQFIHLEWQSSKQLEENIQST